MKLPTKIIASLIVGIFLFSPVLANADTFNQNNIINDLVFDNTSTMSINDINNFLNGFSGSCISPNSGFQAIDPIGYNPSQGYLYGGFVSAGQVIYDASQAYGINPQVLLTTLEKEQSLVTGQNNFAGYCNNGEQHKYAAAVGYGCPDSGTTYNYTGLSLYQRNGVTVTDTGTTCVNSAAKAGFSQQVIRAAWLLKFGEQRAEGNINWAVIKGGWNNSDDPQTCYGGPMTQGTFQRCPSGASTFYDGYTTIDGTSVHMDDGATAALYWYTPHFSGNQNFFSIFSNWFGSPYVTNKPYAWSVNGQTAYADSGYTQAFSKGITVAPSQKVYLRVSARNLGYETWTKAVVHLGTTYPNDRASSLADSSWLANNRIQMQENSVLPGATATFQFSVTTPATPGTYVEPFNVVADGIAWLNDPGLYYTIDVVNSVSPSNNQHTGLAVGQSITPGQGLLSPDMESALTVASNGNLTLYNDLGPAWSNNVSGVSNPLVVLQGDGNLVEYDGSGHPVWATATTGANNALVLQTDGNLVLYSQGGSALWSSATGSIPSHLARVDEYLPPAGVMYAGQIMQTADRKFTLVLQPDGNLVEYDSTGHPLWASGTSGTNNIVAMQADGNLVIYAANGRALWASGTSGTGISLHLQPDGTMTLSSGGGAMLWTNRVLRVGQALQTANHSDLLVLQPDGNLVEYDSTGHPLWASGTSGTNNIVAMQADGNLVIYAANGRALWASGTSDSHATLTLQPDGNLVIYGGTGRVLWVKH